MFNNFYGGENKQLAKRCIASLKKYKIKHLYFLLENLLDVLKKENRNTCIHLNIPIINILKKAILVETLLNFLNNWEKMPEH
ncbi:hypothetical protein BpHYR1_033327 [Brachionus plicatilis]|uniref:Uncharacterized protein n=1 Tax=Brachionus plicatilis TaxID=10195 RepID=A0A3M7SHM6_BRAPC|nr:hypothetical protein BpHYR1_033327 [Brachionus plicatilis]